MKPIRLLVFSNIIAPYRVAFFNEVNSNTDIAIHVAYLARSETNRSWVVKDEDINYQHSILSGIHWRVSRDKTVHVNFGVAKLFNEFQPHIVFLGTDMLGSSASWLSWWYARRRRIPLIRYEARHAYAHGADQNPVKDWMFRYFVRRMDRYFVYSRLTKAYLMDKYQIDPVHITVGFNVGDSKIFIDKVQAIRKSAEYQRERLSLPTVMMLFVGNLDTRKNILSVLRACEKIESAMEDSVVGLFIAGDGPLRDRVLGAAAKLKRLRIFYLGYLQSTELARYYALSDIFVLPTLMDPASIALSEALHSGLFAIASTQDGSSSNFVCDGVNGFIVDPTDGAALAARMQRAIDIVREEPEEERRARILATVADYTIQRYAERLACLVRELYTARAV